MYVFCVLCLGIVIPHFTTFSIVFSCFLVISLDVLSLALFMDKASSNSNLCVVQFSLMPLTNHFMYTKFVLNGHLSMLAP